MALPDHVLRRMAADADQPSKATLRAEIEQQTREYLAKGNTIKRVGPEANKAAREPVKRSRKDQFEVFKKFSIAKS